MMSLREYAKHRGERGLVGATPMAVSKAIKAGRLVKSVVRDSNGQPKIADPELADREWASGTDYSKAPGQVKAAAAPAPRPRAAPAAQLAPDDPLAPGPIRPPMAPGAGEPPGGRGPLSVNEESAREKHWKANRAELDYRERIGQLVDAEEMKAAVADAFARVRARLAGLPTRLRQQIPHLTAEDAVVVDDFLREALDELALKFEEDEEEDEETPDGDAGG